jgi:hypothetical protein
MRPGWRLSGMAGGHRALARREASLIAASPGATLGSGQGERLEDTMQDTNLLGLALGLTPPWSVTRADFDAVAHRLDIHIDFAPGSRFACPQCGAEGCPAHDAEPMEWRHLNFFQHQAWLHARVPRVRCTACGVKKITALPWARKDSGFTLLFEALIMALVTSMPVKAAARLVGEHDTRLWRVIHHYVEEGRARADASAVTRVAVPRVKPEGRLRPPRDAVMITSRCSSISTPPGSCMSPKARTPRPSRPSPMT